eukprot:7257399-Ditylum_brightwellii.AAC.1
MALSTLKKHVTIRPYIWKYNIWLHADHFDTAKVSEPGFIADIHPNLVNINRMTIDIANRLRRARVNNKDIVQEWKTKHQKEEDSKNGINT